MLGGCTVPVQLVPEPRDSRAIAFRCKVDDKINGALSDTLLVNLLKKFMLQFEVEVLARFAWVRYISD